MEMELYTYWRSSAAYRVRIALNFKGIDANQLPVHLVKDGGAQKKQDYRRINPNGTVPTLVTKEGHNITQSLAAIEYLEEKWPEPSLLTGDSLQRSTIRSLSQIVACDIHPVNNLRVGAYLKSHHGIAQRDLVIWMNHWMRQGLTAYQSIVDDASRFSVGDSATMADICLVPQMYNARRWGLPLEDFSRLVEIEQNCLDLEPFQLAVPENQPDCE